jgi:hypothetical protein
VVSLPLNHRLLSGKPLACSDAFRRRTRLVQATARLRPHCISDAVAGQCLTSVVGCHMKALRQFRYLFLLCTACASVLPVSAASPDERDRQVLEALLLHLLSDSKFDMTQASKNGATIILHTRTPEKTGFLMPHQIRAEIEGRKLPSDAESDMRRRNTPADGKPDTYDSVAAWYTNLTFAARIVVTNLTQIWQGRSLSSFEDAHPKARGWLEAYLPGYSADGTRAVVRAGVGPWAHAAMLTAVLERRSEKWTVVWYYVARFA